jgi:hypothetical protein
MTEHVLSGLTKRRSELAGEAEALRTRLAQIGTDLGHLDAVIRLFDPDYNLAAIRPKRSHGRDIANRGERSRMLFTVLREASEALSTAEIVRRMMEHDGQDACDQRTIKLLVKRVGTALARQETRGVVQSLRETGRAVVWKVVR